MAQNSAEQGASECGGSLSPCAPSSSKRPAKYVGHEFSLLIELRDETLGTVVQMNGPSGQPEALRIQQLSKFERPQAPPGFYLPDSMFTRIQVNLAFSNGLPLKQSTLYAWRVEIDGQHRKSWNARFLVPGPPPGPVFGGPAAPSDITLPPPPEV